MEKSKMNSELNAAIRATANTEANNVNLRNAIKLLQSLSIKSIFNQEERNNIDLVVKNLESKIIEMSDMNEYILDILNKVK